MGGPLLDRILWLLLAAGHAMPILSAFNPAMLTRLYGIAPAGDVSVLMRHRGLLFLAIVLVASWSAFDPHVRMLGISVLGTSIIGFLALYWIGGATSALRQIAIVDAAMLPVLALAAYRTVTS